MTLLAERLSGDPVFNHLSERDRKDLASLAFEMRYSKGQFICLQDDVWKRALYLSAGKLNWVMIAPDGKRQVVFRVSPGSIVWGHSLFDDAPMPASIEAAEDCKVCMWDGEDILPIVSRNVDAVWAITHGLVRSMRAVRDVVYGFAFHPVAGRLASLLLKHYAPAEGQASARDLSLEEMAQMIGSTREVISKILHDFASDGLIEINRVEIKFNDCARLEKIFNE